MNKFKHYFNLVFIAYVVIWPSIQLFLLGGFDGAGRLAILMTIAAIIINFRGLLLAPKPFYLLYVWVVYSIINSLVKGFSAIGDVSFLAWSFMKLIQPVVFCVVLYYELCKKQKFQTGRILFYTLVFFVIIGGIYLRPTLLDDMEVRIMNALGNDYFNTLVFIAPIGVYLILSKKLSIVPYLAIVLVIFAVIIIGAERKAIGGFAITFVISLLALCYYRRTNLVVVSSFLLVLCVAGYMVLNYTILGERLLGGSSVHNAIDTNWFLKLMGDRGVQYVGSWEAFTEEPVTGIGLMNYSIMNTHQHGLPLHSEYMVQLAECGLVGAILKLVFLICAVARIRINFRSRFDVASNFVLISGLLALLFIDFTTWTYDMPAKYIVFSMIFAHHKASKTRIALKVIYNGDTTK